MPSSWYRSPLGRVSRGGSTPYLVLFAMANGGPDHNNCKHLSNQLSWLGFLLKTRRDMLVATRNVTFHTKMC
jgi:hypothetical protein